MAIAIRNNNMYSVCRIERHVGQSLYTQHGAFPLYGKCIRAKLVLTPHI